MIDLVYKEQTYQIRGLIYEVHNRLGIGWDEESYHQAMVEVFNAAGIPIESKVRKIITHRGVEVDRFECDLLVWDLIILELKVLPFTNFAPIHFTQLEGQYRLGLPETFWRKLFITEAKFQGLGCQTELKIPVIWETKKLADFTSSHYLIEQKLLLNIRALLNHPTQYDFLQMKTFLRVLNLPVGLIVNFGKNQLQIYGVNPT